jgi:hypothetical protein
MNCTRFVTGSLAAFAIAALSHRRGRHREAGTEVPARELSVDAPSVCYLSVRPRIDAGWPGSASERPVFTSRSPSTRRIEMSLSMKLPT